MKSVYELQESIHKVELELLTMIKQAEEQLRCEGHFSIYVDLKGVLITYKQEIDKGIYYAENYTIGYTELLYGVVESYKVIKEVCRELIKNTECKKQINYDIRYAS